MSNYQFTTQGSSDVFAPTIAEVKPRREFGRMVFDVEFGDAIIDNEIARWNGHFLTNFNGVGYFAEEVDNNDSRKKIFVIYCDEVFYREYLAHSAIQQDAELDRYTEAC